MNNAAGMPRVVVLASGSGTLLQAILNGQEQGHYRVVGVLSDVVCQALDRAHAANVAGVLVPFEGGKRRAEWNQKIIDAVEKFSPDIIVSAGFMRILGKDFVHRYEGITINTHPALLPAFPGAHAVRDALAYGVKVTGCTVHFVDHGVDTGRIIAQTAVSVLPEDTEDTLHERIKTAERILIVDILNAWPVAPQ